MTKHILEQYHGKLQSNAGAVHPGDKVIFRGNTLHGDFKDIEWLDLQLFGITGKHFSTNQLALLNAMQTCTSYPDTRIWNNRIVGLGGSNRSTYNLSVSAGLAASEAEIFGRGIDIKAITFLQNTVKAITNGTSLDECVRKELKINRGIAGYGRPLTSQDERIQPILKKAKELDLADGPHLKLAFDVEDCLTKGRWRLKMNYGSICAALAADVGLTAKQYYHYAFTLFLAGMPPCFIDAEEKPAGTLFPIAAYDINYQGKAKRKWKSDSDTPTTHL